ncbi:MAG: HDOD domain-containing protein [Planctomycetes bacterium]|nr:HDOD domain-containing protein [Planctomycetota bacterium]
MSSATTDLSRVFGGLIATQRLEVPPMPATATEVMHLCQQETTDAAKLSAVVHRDQTIASNVLRVANSAAYVGQVPCTSLQQACSRLGMQLISEIATAVAVRGRMFADARCAALLTALWRHSVLAGFFSKEIARARRRNVDVAFLCGLLHDIGKAVLLDNVDRAAAGGELSVGEPGLLAAVHEHHVAAGVVLANRWKLPEQIAEAMQCHHEPDSASRFRDLALTVAFADVLAHHTAPNLFAEPLAEEALRRHPALAGLNLYPDQVTELLGLKQKALAVAEGMR